MGKCWSVLFLPGLVLLNDNCNDGSNNGEANDDANGSSNLLREVGVAAVRGSRVRVLGGVGEGGSDVVHDGVVGSEGYIDGVAAVVVAAVVALGVAHGLIVGEFDDCVGAGVVGGVDEFRSAGHEFVGGLSVDSGCCLQGSQFSVLRRRVSECENGGNREIRGTYSGDGVIRSASRVGGIHNREEIADWSLNVDCSCVIDDDSEDFISSSCNGRVEVKYPFVQALMRIKSSLESPVAPDSPSVPEVSSPATRGTHEAYSNC